MAMMELVDAIGRYGLPTVAAGIVLWLYVHSQRREEARMDRLDARLERNGDSVAARIDTVERKIDMVQTQVERMAQQADVSAAGRVECHRMFRSIDNTLDTIQSELADHSDRIERIECVVLPPIPD